MDNKFKRIIEYKKRKGSIRKPKYATRKLSIGLVSCMLGYALLVSPSSVEAAELDNRAVAEETAEPETTSGEDNLVEENEENKEDLSEENKEEAPAVDAGSAETENISEENLEEENKETSAEGSVEKETPAPAEEEKPAETTENTDAPTEKGNNRRNSKF